MRVSKELIKKIRQKQARIAVLGLGRVGLPTAGLFADAGYEVIGIDVNEELVRNISSMELRLREPGLDDLIENVTKSGKFKATLDIIQAAKADIKVVCVQTPLTKSNEPDLAHLKKAIENIANESLEGKLVVVVSTTPPGTSKNLVARVLEKGSGLKCGEDFWLAYCPERIAPGRAIQEFTGNSRLVGGFDLESGNLAAELFGTVTRGGILVTDCLSAEVAKLAENTFRDVNIAFANELALICEQIGADAIEVIHLANTHPRVNIHRPSCGVGGPCLTKDPFLLLHLIKQTHLRLNLIEYSRKLNDFMAAHTVELIVNALEKEGKNIEKSRIAVLGVAYKGETGDATNSPAERIIGELMSLKAIVIVYDPYSKEAFGAERARNIVEAVKEADCVVIATDHKTFKKLDLQKIKTFMRANPIIVDGKRIVNPMEAKKTGFIFFGIGYGVKAPYEMSTD